MGKILRKALRLLGLIVVSIISYNILFGPSILYWLILLTGGGDRFIDLPGDDYLLVINEVFAEYDMTFEQDDSGYDGKVVLVIYEEKSKVPYTEILINDFTELKPTYRSTRSDLVFSSYEKYDKKSTIIVDYPHYCIIDDTNEKISIEKLGITVDYGNIVTTDDTEPIRYVIYLEPRSTISPSKKYDEERLEELYQRILSNYKKIIAEVSIFNRSFKSH